MILNSSNIAASKYGNIVKPYMTLETLRTIYFSYFHSVLIYGIIFWGNPVHSQHIFIIQKRMIRLITNLEVKDSCHCVFKELGILPLYSQYFYSLLIFVAKNRDLLKPTLTSTPSAQDIKMITTCHQHNWKYSREESIFQELRPTITCR